MFYGWPALSRRLSERTPDGRPVYQVANDLASYREMLGITEGWKLEAFHNHAHFSLRDGEEACLGYQLRDAQVTEAILSNRFPGRRFVLQISPLDLNTVYQASEDAPTEDDAEWEPNGPLAGVVLQNRLKQPGVEADVVRAEVFEAYREWFCAECQRRWRYDVDYLREAFPGTRWADCPTCGLPQVVAVRTLRRLMPDRSRSSAQG